MFRSSTSGSPSASVKSSRQRPVQQKPVTVQVASCAERAFHPPSTSPSAVPRSPLKVSSPLSGGRPLSPSPSLPLSAWCEPAVERGVSPTSRVSASSSHMGSVAVSPPQPVPVDFGTLPTRSSTVVPEATRATPPPVRTVYRPNSVDLRQVVTAKSIKEIQRQCVERMQKKAELELEELKSKYAAYSEDIKKQENKKIKKLESKIKSYGHEIEKLRPQETISCWAGIKSCFGWKTVNKA